MAISCFLTKQQIRAIRLIINELRFIRCVSLVTVSLVITHCARHSFATSVTLANKVTMENVAKMLGHSSTRMTQHYARVLDESILEDMMCVDNKLFGNNSNIENNGTTNNPK
nr:tyrosine-type recombinase/integrase [uncultured Dysgonomonas sp.]